MNLLEYQMSDIEMIPKKYISDMNNEGTSRKVGIFCNDENSTSANLSTGNRNLKKYIYFTHLQ